MCIKINTACVHTHILNFWKLKTKQSSMFFTRTWGNKEKIE